jgi:hypothetical protein
MITMDTRVRHAKTGANGQSGTTKCGEYDYGADLLTKYLYPMFAIAVAPGVTNVMHAAKYVNVARATPSERIFVGKISLL